MYKKILSLILSITLLLGIIIPASAAESEDNVSGIYILTEDVPSEVIEHVQNSIAGMISDLYDLSDVTVGTPFKVYRAYYDLYYFVVYCNGEAVGTYRVYEKDNGYTGIFSENIDIVGELQRVVRTSVNSPAKIISGNHDDIYAVVDSKVYTIVSDPTGASTPEQELALQTAANNTETVVDISEGIEFDIPSNQARTSPSYKFLQIGWAETQGSLPWCMAYVTASIMRYITGEDVSTISARSVMEWAYPDLSTADLEDTALSTSKADAYANTYGIDPTYTASTRTYAQVTSEIIAGNPLAFICDNLNTGTKKSHAFVCRGYNDNSGNSFYSIWNPWYDEYERIYTSDLTYVNAAGTAKYLWSATMYGWD